MVCLVFSLDSPLALSLSVPWAIWHRPWFYYGGSFCCQYSPPLVTNLDAQFQHSQPTSPSSYSTPQSSTWLEQPKAETLTRERALFLNQGFKTWDLYFGSTLDRIQCDITNMLDKMQQDKMSPNLFMWIQFKRKMVPSCWKTMHMVHVESWELS